MKQYLELLQETFTKGIEKQDRTGTGTKSLFGRQIRFNLQEGLPLVTTKRLHTKSIIHELLWFLKGDTNIKYLNDNGVSTWDKWADENGELGKIYGGQWRHWGWSNGKSYDQIEQLINGIKSNHDSRRHIINSWNVADLPDESLTPQQNVYNGKMALAPCHCLVQFYVAGGKLSCQLYQRSADIFLGLPFNIASYAMLTHMVAQQCDLDVGDFVWTGGDVHLYNNHIEQAKIQLQRTPKALPTLNFPHKPESIFDYKFEDFIIEGYKPSPSISAPIAV